MACRGISCLTPVIGMVPVFGHAGIALDMDAAACLHARAGTGRRVVSAPLQQGEDGFI